MSTRGDVSFEDLKKIIENVEKQPCLYNYNLQSYKNVSLRNKAWGEISAAVGFPVKQCRQIWNRLRNAHTHAISRRTNRAIGATQLSKWTYDDELAFLAPYLLVGKKKNGNNPKKKPEDSSDDVQILLVENDSPKDEKSNESIKWESDDLEYLESEELQAKFVESDELQELIYDEPEQHQTSSSKQKIDLEKASRNPRKRKLKPEDDESTKMGNEVYLLFQYLAKTMSKLPKLEQIRLKGDIMKLVTAAELRAAENSQSSSARRRKIVYRESARHADSDTSYSDDPLT